ncbi:hypothetical protein ASZ90_019110 [hydrocarbon metagenome]|uniref:GIY-YIG domain-containing protein n=1 Tax=hydrocarbon metagenome TaxID=938273 RepID=A0A0W8E4E4_9ZZZZ
MRKRDLDALYRILDWYEHREGNRIYIGEISRKTLPAKGWCFFYEKGECRQKTSEPRIVRVESYSEQDEKISIYNQLLTHRGNIAGVYSGGGNHRRSFLRKHIGTAIMNKLARSCTTWEEDQVNASTRKTEHWLESLVSEVTGSMEVLVVPIDNNRDMGRIAKYIEKNAIALLSNFNKDPVDSPSSDWLGSRCSNPLVRGSGVWNSNGVMYQYDQHFLEVFKRIVRGSVKSD